MIQGWWRTRPEILWNRTPKEFAIFKPTEQVTHSGVSGGGEVSLHPKEVWMYKS